MLVLDKKRYLGFLQEHACFEDLKDKPGVAIFLFQVSILFIAPDFRIAYDAAYLTTVMTTIVW